MVKARNIWKKYEQRQLRLDDARTDQDDIIRHTPQLSMLATITTLIT
jgi:hypothetical protein